MSDPTTQTILATLLEVKSEQGEMRADVKNAIELQKEHIITDRITHANHGERIQSLEESRRKVRITAALISGVGSGLIATVVWALDKFL